MKRALLTIFALVIVGCSSSSSPTAPTPVQTTTTAPAAPTFPSLSGVWTGTVTFTMAVVIPRPQSVTETCNARWTNTQSGGTFSGTLTLSGSTATNATSGTNCGPGSTYTGSVTTAAAVSIPNLNGLPIGGVTWNGTLLNDATCGLRAVTAPMAGTVSGRSWNMTQQDSWLCINKTVQVDRTLLVQLTQ